MSDRPTLHFSTTRRPPGRRPARILGWTLLAVLVVAAVWAVVLAAVWAYAWWQLGGDDVPALEEQAGGLGASGVAAPADATTVLVTMTGPVDPTVPRPPELVGSVALVQFGGPRDEPAVLLLPARLPVSVDGQGELALSEAQREGGSDLLVRALTDYAGVRIDHVVSLSVDALPVLVDAVGPVEVCGPDGCSRPTGEELATRLATAPDEELARLAADVAGSLGQRLDRRWAATSPLAVRRVVAIVSREVTTDVSLRGTRLLEVFEALASPFRLDLDELPLVADPATGGIVVLHEPAMVRFQHLREGTRLAGGAPGGEELEADLVAAVDVAVLNGAGVAGLAGRVQGELSAAGFTVVGTGNAPSFDLESTVVQYLDDEPEVAFAAARLAEELGGVTLEAVASSPVFEGEPVDVLVTVGGDLAEE